MLQKITRFCVVGGINTIVDIGMLNLLVVVSGVTYGGWFALWKSLSFMTATINSYVLNKHWTWKSVKVSSWKEYFGFLVVSFGAMVVNVIIASLVVHNPWSAQIFTPTLWLNIGAIAASGSSWLWNFILYDRLIFKSYN